MPSTTFVTPPTKQIPNCPQCSGFDVTTVCYGWVCRPCHGTDAMREVAAMTQCQPEGRGSSHRAEPYSSLPTPPPPPWDPTIRDGRRRWSEEWCRRNGLCGGKGAAVTDEDMADEEMAGRRRGKSNCLTGLRHNHRRLRSLFKTYEDTCYKSFAAFLDLESAVLGHHSDEEEARE